MAQRAIDLARANRSDHDPFHPTPTLGLRGGLGKTLLIAFLLLAIVPLSLLAFFTYHQIQRTTRERLTATLETLVVVKESHLQDWVEGYERQMRSLAEAPDLKAGGAAGGYVQLEQILSERLAKAQATDPTLTALLLVNQETGDAIATTDAAAIHQQTLSLLLDDDRHLTILSDTTADRAPLVAVRYEWDNWQLIGLLDWHALQEIIADSASIADGTTTRLATSDGLITSSQGLRPMHDRDSGGRAALNVQTAGVAQALEGYSGSGDYVNDEGVPVLGAYRWNPELQLAIVAEQAKTQALAMGNQLAAIVIAGTLVVALATAAIAAAVTRRLTFPIVQLTETAAWMARGDLNQQVTIHRRDEIGVLARAFNRMASELRLLYGQLEAKVVERTQQLEAAHERTRYYNMQLTISAEVARVASSIRDVDILLRTVTELIGNAFELHYASIYLLDDEGQRAVWKAGSTARLASPRYAKVGSSSLVGMVAADGQNRVWRRTTRAGSNATPSSIPCLPVECEMALPLRTKENVLGVLDLQSNHADDFDANDEMVFQSLANQIGIAIENAQAYTLERATVERLRELDRIQSQFLTNMSHALRTPLNSIIGFSRVMLNELDGPLTDLQRTDLEVVYQSGRELLGLINDMLDLSHLDIGTAPFTLANVDLAEIVEGVMATGQALARGSPVRLHQDLPDNMPILYTDGQRLRQVILALVANAIKFTQEGDVLLRVTREDGQVTISVSDSGGGIPQAEQAIIFADTRHNEGGVSEDEPGFGLAISKRVVERLGGRIWLENRKDTGATFTFTLPIRSGDMTSPGPHVDQTDKGSPGMLTENGADSYVQEA
jgi:signal transduction histidine kinase/HAMP domain-containing protein